jgi:Helix-turn-helix.
MKSKMRMYLVNARQEKAYSQRKTAREAQLTFQHYSKIESGERGERMSLLTGGRIAKALGMSIDDFFDLETKYQEELDVVD